MLSTTKVLGASELKHQLQVPPDQKWILLHRLFFVCGLTLKWIQHEEPSHLDKSRWQWQAARWTTSPTTWLCSAKSWTTCSGPLSLFSGGAFVPQCYKLILAKKAKQNVLCQSWCIIGAELPVQITWCDGTVINRKDGGLASRISYCLFT